MCAYRIVHNEKGLQISEDEQKWPFEASCQLLAHIMYITKLGCRGKSLSIVTAGLR